MSNNKESSSAVKKQEDGDAPESNARDDKRDVKPVKTLNRVPRACNACRKQKMRCEGAENPPCRRCRHAGLECLFEKPSREPTLTGEAGLERIRSLEAQVSEIQQSQVAIHTTLAELVHHLRNSMPSTFPQSSFSPPNRLPPSFPAAGSPASSTPSSSGQMMIDHTLQSNASDPSTVSLLNSSHPRPIRTPASGGSYRSPVISAPGQRPSLPSGEVAAAQLTASNGTYPSNQLYPPGGPHQGPTLPPISTIQDMSSSRSGPSNVSSLRYHHGENPSPPRLAHGKQVPSRHSSPGRRSPKRKAPVSSTVASSNTSDVDEDDNGELPASGLVAPWEVLRGLADVAIERANQENGDHSEPQSRGRSLSPESKQGKPSKRRKINHLPRTQTQVTPDAVTKRIISEAEARELFKIFYAGCSTFLPVFDSHFDTFESLFDRSPFAFDCICMVASRVRDGGGPPSDVYLALLDECQRKSRATLFASVSRAEAVQAMILVSGWSDNGWLSGGHAVRMAVELSMHQAWPKLMKRIETGKASRSNDDRKLITAARTWFCLYLFEHQISYGTGRPAILKDDESIWSCRLLLKHPLAIDDDMRLVSTVELMAIRERITNKLSPVDRPVDERTFAVLREADVEFRDWFETWDNAFSQKYEDAAFYRQSLQIQKLLAELFHNATALRGIDGPEDVQKTPTVQRELAHNSLAIAQQALSICINSTSYREGLKYAVHYTHATATFSASFLLRLARLFPDLCDMDLIRTLVERLVVVLSEIPARRYAYTLQLMLKKSKKRRAGLSRSPTVTRQPPAPTGPDRPQDGHVFARHMQTDPVTPTFERTYSHPEIIPHAAHLVPSAAPQFNADAANIDQIWRGFEGVTNEQLPVWLSDQSLGGNSFSQQGLEAFMMPAEYEYQRAQTAPQIW